MTKPLAQTLTAATQGVKARKRQSRTPRAPKRAQAMKPTDERGNHNDTQSAGMATRITPPIETLRSRGQLTGDEFSILNQYSLAVATAFGSETRSCCDNSVRGNGGDGPGAAVSRARAFVSQLENRSGPHVTLIQAVCKEDKTLTKWCIEKYGHKVRYRKGKPPEIVPKGSEHGRLRIKQALDELKDAARRMKKG